jgi:hypothetical protein
MKNTEEQHDLWSDFCGQSVWKQVKWQYGDNRTDWETLQAQV